MTDKHNKTGLLILPVMRNDVQPREIILMHIKRLEDKYSTGLPLTS